MADGKFVDVKMPAETWMQNTQHVFVVPTPSHAVKAEIDPDHQVPDINRANNSAAVK